MTTAAADHTAEEMADLVEYCWGDETTAWGRRRHQDLHPVPYNVTWFEVRCCVAALRSRLLFCDGFAIR